jgi:hypothetical protein
MLFSLSSTNCFGDIENSNSISDANKHALLVIDYIRRLAGRAIITTVICGNLEIS